MRQSIRVKGHEPEGKRANGVFEKTDLFEGDKGGFHLYRIPGLAVTSKGTVLAYCEGRSQNNDWSESAVLLRRSTDGGRTWDEPRKIAHTGERVTLANTETQTVHNVAAIADAKTETVHFLYSVNYTRVFSIRSDDGGVSFTEPVEITKIFESFRAACDWKVLAGGLAHGIQLKNGRLLMPVWLAYGEPNRHRPSVVTTIFSDDHGRTWECGDIAIPNTPEWVNPSESIAVQLADGRVMLNVRTESAKNRRLVAISPDGATRWSEPCFDEALVEPVCMASMVRLSEKPGSDRNRMLFANPDNLETGKIYQVVKGARKDRKNLSIRLSYDEGETWRVHKPLEPGGSAYSDLAVLPDGGILCLYERAFEGLEETSAYGLLTIARFDLEWLTEGADALPKKAPGNEAAAQKAGDRHPGNPQGACCQ